MNLLNMLIIDYVLIVNIICVKQLFIRCQRAKAQALSLDPNPFLEEAHIDAALLR